MEYLLPSAELVEQIHEEPDAEREQREIRLLGRQMMLRRQGPVPHVTAFHVNVTSRRCYSPGSHHPPSARVRWTASTMSRSKLIPIDEHSRSNSSMVIGRTPRRYLLT